MNTNVKQTSKTKELTKLTSTKKRLINPSSRQLIQDSPKLISMALGRKWHHVIVSKPKNGFSFTLFWIKSDNAVPEPVAQSVKAYKTKNECITAIKKMTDAMPSNHFLDNINCYDYRLQKVDTKIKHTSWYEI